MFLLQIDSEQALLNLHQDFLGEENLVVQEKEDLRAQLQETESNYLTIIANMKVVSARASSELPRVHGGCTETVLMLNKKARHL